jgi:hypothetical protein
MSENTSGSPSGEKPSQVLVEKGLELQRERRALDADLNRIRKRIGELGREQDSADMEASPPAELNDAELADVAGGFLRFTFSTSIEGLVIRASPAGAKVSIGSILTDVVACL